jgi:putative acetyltransferase
MQSDAVTIQLDRPDAPDVRRLLEEHLVDMFATSPAESVHALDLAALAHPSITFWTARDDRGALLGCGALAGHDDGTGEVKSMRTAAEARGRGVAALLVEVIVAEARARGYSRLRLETGSEDFFAPARRLYARAGFTERGPFGSYVEDPNSVFMELDLRSGAASA